MAPNKTVVVTDRAAATRPFCIVRIFPMPWLTLKKS